MIIFISGVSCVGKTTIGNKLSNLLGYHFFDIDKETEEYFGISLEKLQNQFITVYSYRKKAAKVLKHILTLKESENCVIALPPSGLMHEYWRVVKKAGGIAIVITDNPENILQRITFYDIDSQPVDMHLTEKDEELYLKEIKKDITYFGKTYKRADIIIDISGMDSDAATNKLKIELEKEIVNCP